MYRDDHLSDRSIKRKTTKRRKTVLDRERLCTRHRQRVVYGEKATKISEEKRVRRLAFADMFTQRKRLLSFYSHVYSEKIP